MNYRFVNLKKLIDPWSVPHFLFGMVMALGALAFGQHLLVSFAATLAVALLWELAERRFRLSEAPGNAWMDVLLPLIAFVMTILLIDTAVIDRERRIALFAVSILLYMTMNFFAWRARIERDREFRG